MNGQVLFTPKTGKFSDNIRDGVPIMEVAKTYGERAREYDRDILATKVYKGPDQTASMFRDHWPKDKSKSVRILDVGGGTGALAEVLKRMDFEHIDCLEPSEGMMDLAREKKVYDKYYEEFIGEETCSIAAGTYEGVASSGSVGPSHVPCSGVAEIIRLCRPGAIVCLGFRLMFLTDKNTYFAQNWDETIESLRRDGFIEVLEVRETEEWHEHHKGYIIAFKVLKSEGVTSEM